MAFEAIANGGTVYRTFERCRILIGVTGETQAGGRRGDQLNPGDVFVDSNFVTNVTAERDRGVDRFAFRLVLMARGAFCRVYVLVEGYRVNVREGHRTP